MVSDFTGWHRVGGHSFQFYATDDEVAEWLLETLPAEFAPYIVFREDPKPPRLVVHEWDIADIRRSFTEDRDARHWIKSAVLSRDLNASDIFVPSDLGKLSFGGLISVRLGSDWKGRRETTDMGLIDRIRHDRTSAEQRQPEYREIFERLRRTMGKRLVVDTDDWPMTVRAEAAQARGAVTFAAAIRRRT